MQLTIEIPDELAAKIQREAHSRSMTVDKWIATAANKELPIQPDPAFANRTPKERAEAFVKWAKSFPPTPPLSDEAISRENLYEDRG